MIDNYNSGWEWDPFLEHLSFSRATRLKTYLFLVPNCLAAQSLLLVPVVRFESHCNAMETSAEEVLSAGVMSPK